MSTSGKPLRRYSRYNSLAKLYAQHRDNGLGHLVEPEMAGCRVTPDLRILKSPPREGQAAARRWCAAEYQPVQSLLCAGSALISL